MRREPTPAGKLLWHLLRDRSLSRWKFRRQHPAGHYVLDFYCPRLGHAIELDGAGHLDKAGAAGDAYRTSELGRLGITVVRFENCSVLENPEWVLSKISDAIHTADVSRFGNPSPPAVRS